MTRDVTVIDLAEARRVVDAAVQTSQELGVPVYALVVDPHGQTVAAARVDGANFFSERIARGKALTAIGMKTPTEVWENLSATNPGFAGGITSVPDFTPFAGGVPLTVDGAVVGAVGISGGTPAEDIEIAAAAVAALS